MKPRLIETRRIVRSPEAASDGDSQPFVVSRLSLDKKRENLYRAIGRTRAFLHPNDDAAQAMARLREDWPAPKYFIESGRKAIEDKGMSGLDAFYYAMIPDLTRTSLSQQWGERPPLHTLARMSRFLQTLYVGVHEERFYLVLLNGRGRLLRAALLQKGSEDSAPFYLRQLLATALMEGAKYIVLAHNHPRGTRKPSKEDLLCTLRTLNVTAPLKLLLLDHIIVTRDGAVSIRESGLLPDLLWTATLPGNRIVREWLDAEQLVEDETQ